MKKRILSLLLAMMMVVSLLPAAALADGEPTLNNEAAQNFYQDENNSNLWHIANLTGLEEFRDSVNTGHSYNGETVMLDTDIDMTSVNDWSPIGSSSGKSFAGTFDGNDKTLSNLTAKYNNADSGGGFFGNIDGPTAKVQNVIFDNFHIESTLFNDAGRIKGNVYGIVSAYAYGTVGFENVTVKNSSVKAYGKVGAVLGMAAELGSSITSFTNCHVENTTVQGTYNCATFCGNAQNVVSMTNCTGKATWMQNDLKIDSNWTKYGEIPGYAGTYAINENTQYYCVAWADNYVQFFANDGKLGSELADGKAAYSSVAQIIRDGINGEIYGTLADAVAAAQEGDTIKLLCSCEGKAISITKGVTIDFNGFTYTVAAPAAGSANTQNQAFHIEAVGKNVTLKNGTIAIADANMTLETASKPITRVIQNYANLTLDGMTITDLNLRYRKDGEHIEAPTLNTQDTLIELDFGTVTIKDCAITVTGAGRFAIAVDDWNNGVYSAGTHVTIETGNLIVGNIRYYAEGNGTDCSERHAEDLKSTLTFVDGSFTGLIYDTAAAYDGNKLVLPESGDYQLQSEADNVYRISAKSSSVARIGDLFYVSITEAIEAAQNNDIIYLLCDDKCQDDTDIVLPDPSVKKVSICVGSYTLPGEISAPAGCTLVKSGKDFNLTYYALEKEHVHEFEYNNIESGWHEVWCKGCEFHEHQQHKYVNGECVCGAYDYTIYTLNVYLYDETAKTYYVYDVENKTYSSKAEKTPYISKDYGKNNVVTLEAPDLTGMSLSFKQWNKSAQDGLKVSNKQKYVFALYSNVDLYIIYTKNAIESSGEEVTVDFVNMTAVNEGGKNKIVFTEAHSIADNKKISECGILWATNKMLGYKDNNTDLSHTFDLALLMKTNPTVQENASTHKTQAHSGDWTLKLGVGTSLDARVYALPYVVVDGKTYYGSTVQSVTFNERLAMIAPQVEFTNVSAVEETTGKKKIVFTETHSVAYGKITESGILYAISKDFDPEYMNADDAVVKLGKSAVIEKLKEWSNDANHKSGHSTKASNGDWTLKLGVGTSLDAYVYALPYIVVDGTTIYGELAYGTWDSLQQREG